MGRRNYRDKVHNQRPKLRQTMPFEDYDGMVVCGPSHIVTNPLDRQAWGDGPKKRKQWRIRWAAANPVSHGGYPPATHAVEIAHNDVAICLIRLAYPPERRYDFVWLGQHLVDYNNEDTALDLAIEAIAVAFETSGLGVDFDGLTVHPVAYTVT